MLRTRGLIEYGQGSTVMLLPAGMALAGEVGRPATDEDLQAFWFRLCSSSQERILRVLIEEYPNSMTRASVAESSQQSATSGSFANNLSTLRTMGAIEYGPNSTVQASKNLWLPEKRKRAA